MPDLRAMKADVAAFADAIGQPLASWQAEALRFESRVTCVLAGRQMGKSRALALTALWAAFRARERRSLVISASEDAARRLLGECRRIAQSSDLLSGSVVDEQGGLLRLTNGSEVRSVAASERAVRGWSVDALLIDEACLLPAALVMDAAIPTTTARPQALILLASTASAAAGPFFDLVRLGEVGSEHVRAFRWVSRVAGGACDARGSRRRRSRRIARRCTRCGLTRSTARHSPAVPTACFRCGRSRRRRSISSRTSWA